MPHQSHNLYQKEHKTLFLSPHNTTYFLHKYIFLYWPNLIIPSHFTLPTTIWVYSMITILNWLLNPKGSFTIFVAFCIVEQAKHSPFFTTLLSHSSLGITLSWCHPSGSTALLHCQLLPSLQFLWNLGFWLHIETNDNQFYCLQPNPSTEPISFTRMDQSP